MKRTVVILLCIASLLSLSACTNRISYERIPITKENYDEYLNITIYITDFSAVVSKQTENYSNSLISPKTELSSKSYDLSLVVHIETSRKMNCTFEDIHITYSADHTYPWDVFQNGRLNSLISPDTSVSTDMEGRSHTSYVATKTDSPSVDVKTSHLTSTDDIIGSIEGFVLVPKN